MTVFHLMHAFGLKSEYSHTISLFIEETEAFISQGNVKPWRSWHYLTSVWALDTVTYWTGSLTHRSKKRE